MDQKTLRAATIAQSPTLQEILQYRYHHGTNIGSCFVLDKSISPSMFLADNGSSELAAVTASISAIGVDATKAKWEAHWREMASNADFDWLVNDANCTSIRLPIGFWNLGSEMCKGTAFEEVASVYESSFRTIMAVIVRARKKGIGTLIDLYGLPIEFNLGDDIVAFNEEVAIWSNQVNKELALRCILMLVASVSNVEGVIGIQVCNVAGCDALLMYAFYDLLLENVSRIEPRIPIYIHDAWNLPDAIRYAKTKNSIRSEEVNPVVVDTHCYWDIYINDTSRDPFSVLAEVSEKFSDLANEDRNVSDTGAAQFIVGEYNCLLSTSDWHESPQPAQDQIIARFGQEQCKQWQENSGGSFFWTYKFESPGWRELSFVEQVVVKAITPPPNLLLQNAIIKERAAHAQSLRNKKKSEARLAHETFWDLFECKEKFEHWRFDMGWNLGWHDASQFFTHRANGRFGCVGGTGGDKIGLVELWIRKRILDTEQKGDFVWIFEHGIRQGIADYYAATGIS